MGVTRPQEKEGTAGPPSCHFACLSAIQLQCCPVILPAAGTPCPGLWQLPCDREVESHTLGREELELPQGWAPEDTQQPSGSRVPREEQGPGWSGHQDPVRDLQPEKRGWGRTRAPQGPSGDSPPTLGPPTASSPMSPGHGGGCNLSAWKEVWLASSQLPSES